MVDFGICVEDGRLVPRLIEFQAFPSLYAFQLLILGCIRKAFRAIPRELDLVVRRNERRVIT